MSNTKFLIVLAYYKRPKIVLNALHSIKNLNYDNWELHFIDDSGDDSFKDILFSYGFDNKKVKYSAIYESDETKIKKGGSSHGHYINEAIKNSEADFTTILCDDDALVKDSFLQLDFFIKQNKSLEWFYNRVYFYDPSKEFYLNSNSRTEVQQNNYKSFYDLNNYFEPINPQNRVDGSQVIYKNSLFKNNLVRYPYPQTMNLDSSILGQIYRVSGPCWPSYVYTQYKAAFADQMGNRSSTFILNDS
jgi:hypothetical protein